MLSDSAWNPVSTAIDQCESMGRSYPSDRVLWSIADHSSRYTWFGRSATSWAVRLMRRSNCGFAAAVVVGGAELTAVVAGAGAAGAGSTAIVAAEGSSRP